MDVTNWEISDRFEYIDNKLKMVLMFSGVCLFSNLLFLSQLGYSVENLIGNCYGWDCSYTLYVIVGILLISCIMIFALAIIRYGNNMDKIRGKYQK